MVCVRVSSLQCSGSCSGVMFLWLLLVAAYSTNCMSVLLLAFFPPFSHPAVSGSGYRTACSFHPSQLHHHVLSIPQSPPPLIIHQHPHCSFLTPKPLDFTQRHALAVSLMSGTTQTSAVGKRLLLLLVRIRWR